MASHTPCQLPLPLLCQIWLTSLTGPPGSILPSQKSLLRTVVALSPSPSPLSEKIRTILLLNVALLYAFEGCLDLATITFEEAIVRSPHCALAHFGLGLTSFLQENDFNAIHAWKACLASFEVVAPEGDQYGEYISNNDILYRMWQSSRYEEDQLGHRGEVEQEKNDKLQQWLLNKEVVLWNISVAERRWMETMNAFYHPGQHVGLDENTDMLFVNGIPAGMLFGPPSELMQEVHMQSQEGSERYQKGPTEEIDLNRANANAENHVPPRAGPSSASTEVASASISELIPPRRGKDHFVPDISSPSTLTATTDGHHLTALENRGQASALFQGDIQAEYPKRRTDNIAIRPAATSTMGNCQAALMPSPPDSRPNSRTRILDSATPSSILDSATPSSKLEPKKPLPPLPGRLPDISNLTPRYTLRVPQTGGSTPTSRYTLRIPQKTTKFTATRTTLSAKASSLTRFFTKSKRGEPKSSTTLYASAGAGFGFGASVGGSIPASHSAPPGSVTSKTRAPPGDKKQGKGKETTPKGQYRPESWYPFPAGHKDHQTWAEFEEAMRESERERKSTEVDLSVKMDWEKRMEANVAAEMKTPKRLYFPREDIKLTPQVKHGLESGRGLSYEEESTMGTIPLQTQNQSLPASLPTRIDHANHFSSSAAASVPVWPERSSSRVAAESSSAAPPYPPAPPLQQREKLTSRYTLEPKKKIGKGKGKARENQHARVDDEAPHGSGVADRNADDAEEEPVKHLDLLIPATFQGFGDGIHGQWFGGKWV